MIEEILISFPPKTWADILDVMSGEAPQDPYLTLTLASSVRYEMDEYLFQHSKKKVEIKAS